MRKPFGLAPLVLALVCAAFCSLAAPRAGAQAPPCDPAMNGKYSGQLRVLAVPQDRGRYGACNDYGYYSGDSWAGHRDLPPGYWVYAYPNWYIFQHRAQANQPSPSCDPSFNGQYFGQLRVLNVPQDRAQYGACKDYGYYDGSSWAGYTDLPPGYWTYSYPNWYIWTGKRL